MTLQARGKLIAGMHGLLPEPRDACPASWISCLLNYYYAWLGRFD